MPSVFCGANIWKPFLLSKHGPVPESRGFLSSLKRSAERLLGSIRAIGALKHNSHKIQIWETWPASHKPLQPRLGSLLRGWMVIVIRHQEDDRKHTILLKICHFKNLEKCSYLVAVSKSVSISSKLLFSSTQDAVAMNTATCDLEFYPELYK